MNYINRIKEKYQIKTTEKSKYITMEDFESDQKKLEEAIEDFFHPSECSEQTTKLYKKTINELFRKDKNYRLLELWENPEPGTLIRYFMKDQIGNISLGIGIINKVTPIEIYINYHNNKKNKIINRHHLIVTPYTEAQMGILRLKQSLKQKMSSIKSIKIK